mgnify:CR=1 FL=1
MEGGETVFGLPVSLGTVMRQEAEMAEALKPASRTDGCSPYIPRQSPTPEVSRVVP